MNPHHDPDHHQIYPAADDSHSSYPSGKKLRQNLSTTSELSCGQIDWITHKGKNNALIQSSSTGGDSLPAQPVSTSVVRGSHPGGLEQPS